MANPTAPESLPGPSGLSTRKVSKSYPGIQALKDVSLDVEVGEILAVLGPSGSGKSTLLHVIAGLERADSGRVYWGGQPLEEVPTHRRGFGLMFQEFALFPHMNVFDNVAFGLRMQDLPSDRVGSRVHEVLDLVGLSEMGSREVDTLSGGERQRIALARSLAPEPKLLMLDEPLGALDRTLRERLMLDLPRILGEMNQTALYITHDQEEAFAVADRVAVMQAGEVRQIGAPQDLYRNPKGIFVAQFLGLTNLLEAERVQEGDRWVWETELGSFPAAADQDSGRALLLRPDRVRLDGRGEHVLEGTVVERSFRGSTQRVVLEIKGLSLTFDFPSSVSVPSPGAAAEISFQADQALQVLQ